MSKNQSRSRRPIVVLIAVAIVIFLIVVGASLNNKNQTNQNQAQEPSYGVPADIKKAVRNAKTVEQVKEAIVPSLGKYGLTLDLNNAPFKQDFAKWDNITEIDLADLKNFALMFYYEWNKYPIHWVTGSKLIGIIFVKNLQAYGYGYGQPLELAALPTNNYMLYSLPHVIATDYTRETFHHEFFHANIFRRKGTASAFPRWLACNDDDFQYGSGGIGAYRNNPNIYSDFPTKGFVSGYAESVIEEDMAETYADLMTDRSNTQLQLHLPQDSILFCKVTYLKELIYQLEPEMNDEYFVRIHQTSK